MAASLPAPACPAITTCAGLMVQACAALLACALHVSRGGRRAYLRGMVEGAL